MNPEVTRRSELLASLSMHGVVFKPGFSASTAILERMASAITGSTTLDPLERVSIWDVSHGGECEGHVVKFADGTECTGPIFGWRT